MAALHKLPAEVTSLILSDLPNFKSLFSAILSHRQFLDIFKENEGCILRHVFLREFSDTKLSQYPLLLRVVMFVIAKSPVKRCWARRIFEDSWQVFRKLNLQELLLPLGLVLASSLQSNKCNSEALGVLRALWNREEPFGWDFQVTEENSRMTKLFNRFNVSAGIPITLRPIALRLMELENEENRAGIEKWVEWSERRYEHLPVAAVGKRELCVKQRGSWESKNFEKEGFFIISKKLGSESHAIPTVLIKISDWPPPLLLSRRYWARKRSYSEICNIPSYKLERHISKFRKLG